MTTHENLDPATRHRLTVEEYLMLDREGACGDRRTEVSDLPVFGAYLLYDVYDCVCGAG